MKLLLVLCAVSLTHGTGLISYNYPSYSVSSDNTGQVAIRTGKIQEYKIVTGLNGKPGSVSFQSVADPSKYLRHRFFLARLDKFDHSQLFRDDATFFVRKNKFYPGYAALESSNFPGYFLRHQGYRVKLHKETSDQLYRMDASFLLAFVSITASFQSKNYPTYYWGTLNNVARITNQKRHQLSLTIVVPGLTGEKGTVSFYLNNGEYLRHRGYVIRDEKPIRIKPDLFRKDATFYHRFNKWFTGFVSFESVNYPGYFIRHAGYYLYIHKSENSALYKNDASFRFLARSSQ